MSSLPTRIMVMLWITIATMGCSESTVSPSEATTNTETANELESTREMIHRAVRPEAVSLVQLLARPDEFHGQFVQLTGFLHYEFESSGLYLHREDHEQHLYKNGIWAQVEFGAPNTQYVLIEGRFNANRRGHMGLWSGMIEDVTRIVPWGRTDSDSKAPN